MFQNGSELVRADFHLHTKEDKEFKYTGDENSFVSDYVNALELQEIRVGVITNHNQFSLREYKAIRKASAKKSIFILPGVELSVKEGRNGVHTLIVFNPNEWLKNGENVIDDFLTTAFCGIENRENENTRCIYDISRTIEELNRFDKDYFIIFAHIEQNSGLIKECAGGMITSLAHNVEFHNRVLGMQKLRTIDNISKLKQWLGYNIAFVEGSDPKRIEEIGKGQKQTYLKIGDFSFSAVKYALQDFENRGFDSLHNCNHGYIESVTFTGGKLNGVPVNFSSELNTLIGIRGSGKSSILEAIRYGFNLKVAPIDEKYKNDLVENIFGSGGQISIQVINKFGEHYEIRRIYGESPSVLSADGANMPISISSIINNPLYFGQKDLSSTGDGYEFKLLQKLVGNKIKNENDKLVKHHSVLVKALTQLIELSNIPEQIEELKAQNRDLDHKLKVFKEKGVAVRLEKQTACNADILKLKSISDKLRNLIINLEPIIKKMDKSEIALHKYTSAYNKDIFDKAQSVTDSVTSIFDNIMAMIKSLKDKEEDLKGISADLSSKVDSLQEEFAAIKREVQDENINPDSFVQYNNHYTENAKKIADLNKLASSREELITTIKKGISERNNTLYNIFKSYSDEIKKINANQSEIHINIVFKGNKSKFKDDLKKNFKGTNISDSKYQRICEQFSDFVSLIEDCVINSGKLLREILTEREFDNLRDMLLKNYTNLIKIECPNSVQIFYHNKLLKQHSIGQRAAALILFILTQQDNDVLIIDQPEDDLDNQVIYNEVIREIKKKKPYIQFIFATHNANIPVLGDAECIITTTYQDNKITLHEGNIDCPDSHDQIVNIMEGGKKAFEKRKLIYEAWK